MTSGRIMFSVALIIILARAYGIDPSNITILGIDLATYELTGPVIWAISFGAFAHAVNWSGDFISFRVWNNGAKVQGPTAFGGGKGNNPLIREISAIKVHLRSASSRIKEQTEIITGENRPKHTGEVIETLETSLLELRRLQEGVARLSGYAKFLLYVWHLAVPVSATMIAVALLMLPSAV